MMYLAYITLHILTFIHCLIWVFFVFGCLYSKTIATLNLYLILPFIYFSWISRQHPILAFKLILIRKYLKELPDVPVNFNKSDLIKNDFDEVLKQLNILEENVPSEKKSTSEEKHNIIVYYFKLEKLYMLPYHFSFLKIRFDDSYENPLTPQGLLILGVILSLYSTLNKSPITMIKNILS